MAAATVCCCAVHGPVAVLAWWRGVGVQRLWATGRCLRRVCLACLEFCPVHSPPPASDPTRPRRVRHLMGCCESKAATDDAADGGSKKLTCGPDAEHNLPEAAGQFEAATPEVAAAVAAPTETLPSPPAPAPATVQEAAPTRELAAAQPNEATPPATTEAVPPPAAAAASAEPASLEQAEATGPAEATDEAAEPPQSPMETVVGAIQLVFQPIASLGRSMSSLFSAEEIPSSGGDSGGGGGSGGGSGGGGGSSGGGVALEATVTRLEALVGGGVSSGAAQGAPPSGTPTAAQLAQLEELVDRLERPQA